MTEEQLEADVQVEESHEAAAPSEQLASPSFDLSQTNKLLQDHMELMRAQQQPQRPQKEEPTLEDDDLFTVGQAKKAFKELQRANEELRVAAKHKDYEEVITKYLPEAIKENPSIRRWIESSESPYEQAYYLAKKSDAYLKEQAFKTRSKDAEKVAKINGSAGNLSSVGGNSTAQGTIDYKNMSDDQFREHAARNMGIY